jgi:nucleoside-diphosphate-sugar epimerase
LPLDGKLPPNPGRNAYALSKEFGERMLRLAAENEPGLSVTSLRFPMLVGEWLERRMGGGQRVPFSMIDLAECTAHLFLEDAARLIAEVLERRLPGYHQYFPAETMDLVGCPPAELVSDHYPGVELRRPLEELSRLVDLSELERELGWKPERRLRVLLDR